MKGSDRKFGSVLPKGGGGGGVVDDGKLFEVFSRSLGGTDTNSW